MGFFSTKSDEDRRAEEVRSGAVAPKRSERRKCWDARDAYFGCLDANNIVDALKDDRQARKACPTQNADFERDCAAAWVSPPLSCLPSHRGTIFLPGMSFCLQKSSR